ncbi:MAG: hypothetical protein SVO96_01240 [Pseudomonadota bacterium]|nr:hypothetical protein [Pseudomonadota bacterium]
MHLPLILSLREMELPSGISVEVEPVKARRDISEAWATAIFTVLASAPASVIASLLLDKFKKDKSAVVTINRKEIALENGELVRVVEETIKIERQ